MRYQDVIRDLCKPEDQMGSVIDTLVVFSEILESMEDLDKDSYLKNMSKAIFTLGFFPFYKVHGFVLRPLFLQAINQTKLTPCEYFLSEAIPTAMTIAMPNKQDDYGKIRDVVLKKFKA